MSQYDKKFWEPKEHITEAITDFKEPIFGVCVKLYGGADSSIVYFTLCHEMKERGLDIPLYVVTLDAETKDWYSHYAKKVIDYTAEKTGIRPVEHLKYYLAHPWTVEDYEYYQDITLAKLVDSKTVNIYYGGLTENPVAEEMTKYWNIEGMHFESYEQAFEQAKERDADRDSNKNKDTIGYGNIPPRINEPFLGVLPFVQKDKRAGTAALYNKMGVIDELLPLTYSCENKKTYEKEKGDIVDGYQEYKHCGICWFCLERAYAFGRLV